jgi:uncharacterized membrane protein
VARFERGTEEFSRVGAFSDGVFAIAATLLVVGVGVPTVRESELGSALSDQIPDIIAFFISFIVIGKYWLAHHQFFSQLGAVNSPLLTANLVYLAAIAFVPYPTGLVSRFDDSPVTVVIYALALATSSLMEAVMFGMAQRGGLLRITFSDAVFRYELVASLLPVLVFAISVPIAFVDTRLALCSWLAVFPAEWLVARAAPTGFEPIE